MKARVALISLCALFLHQVWIEAEEKTKQRFSELDVFELEYASDPQISPDGARVVYVRNSMDIMEGRDPFEALDGQLPTVRTTGSSRQRKETNRHLAGRPTERDSFTWPAPSRDPRSSSGGWIRGRQLGSLNWSDRRAA